MDDLEPGGITNSPRTPWPAFKQEFASRPLSVVIPAMMIPVGTAAFILGQGASRAFTLIPGGELIAHTMGFLLALGGALAMLGTVRLGTLVELLGLVLIAAGATIYASGVILGLGWNGIIAGGAYAAIAIGCIGRVILLSSVAHRLHNGT
jgi:hypothetical protein